MAIKAVVAKLDDVEEQFRGLYVEKNGKFELGVELEGVEGARTYTDFFKLDGALKKERADHKAARERFSALGDRKPEEVIALLDRIPELEAAAAGKIDDTKLNELVETRLKTKLSPIERDLQNARQQLGERDEIIKGFQSKEMRRTIHDAVRQASVAAKVLPEALEDALMLAERVFEVDEHGRVTAKDNVGCTPGVEPSVWLTELQNKRPHWWGPSQGGGAGGANHGGAGGVNPWSADGWNMTQQGAILRENRSKAEQLAKSAGTSIGGPRPVKK